MKPFEGLCDLPEQKVDAGVVTVSAKRTGYDSRENSLPFEGIATIKVEGISLHGSLAFARMLLGFLLEKKKGISKVVHNRLFFKLVDMSSDSIGLSRMAEDSSPLKRIRRGLPRACKKV